jgi:hypothetical protein
MSDEELVEIRKDGSTIGERYVALTIVTSFLPQSSCCLGKIPLIPRGLDDAFPGSLPESNLTVPRPRPPQHLLFGVRCGSEGNRREHSPNTIPSAPGECILRTASGKDSTRVFGFLDCVESETRAGNSQGMGGSLQRGRPHSVWGQVYLNHQQAFP